MLLAEKIVPKLKPDDSSDSDIESTDDEQDATGGSFLSRKDLKALDRELPVRTIMEMGDDVVQLLADANRKEEKNFEKWQTLRGLSDEEADQIINSNEKCKRCLRARRAYRGKRCGRPLLRGEEPRSGSGLP